MIKNIMVASLLHPPPFICLIVTCSLRFSMDSSWQKAAEEVHQATFWLAWHLLFPLSALCKTKADMFPAPQWPLLQVDEIKVSGWSMQLQKSMLVCNEGIGIFGCTGGICPWAWNDKSRTHGILGSRIWWLQPYQTPTTTICLSN